MLTFRVLLPAALLLAVYCAGWHIVTAQAVPDTTEKARKFVAAHEAKLRPLEIAAGLAWWEANTTGSEEAYAKKEAAQNKIDATLADANAFKELKAIHEKKKEIKDATIARCIDVLYLTYLEKQVDPKLLQQMVAKANAVEKAFNVFRAKVDGKEMADSEVRKVLKESKDSARRQAVWEAAKEVGKVVEADLKELVKLRNEAAKQLGFKNFHQMMLTLNEQNTADLMKLFDELDALTREPFTAAKAEIDQKLATNCGVKVEDLRPWHYHDPFFQESPNVFAGSLDAPYAKADILKLCREFYQGIGLPIDDVLARSDLYEKKGKSPHAFCTDIDRDGDVRVLANIVANEYWMGTMLHELGHAVYSSKNIPSTLPYTLRGEAHILATEGVAMMFERFSKSRRFLTKMGVNVEDQDFDATAAKMLRNQLLIFSRWCQVMLRFEKAMYENPDQDLNKLWWDLVEKYQQVKRPTGRNSPDYGSKIHVVSAPVYYHNYMMGQLFASQVHHTITREVLKEDDPDKAIYVGNKDVGQFMKKRVFEPGKMLPWNELTKYATGKELEAKAFAQDFRGK
ncbi:MAG: M2 family metallopeptidase [Planctomycetia bacterium]|nr:M2 family metallopeptidase [Planctomycetia bacterium]